MNEPHVSVIMPAYNRQSYIRDAIDSILGQTLEDFELIVVDDGSDDATPGIVAEYERRDPRVTLLRNPTNMNIAASLNRGLERATGTFVARMDSDDWAYPYRLEKQLAFMIANPKVVMSGGAMEVCDESLRPLNVRHYNLTDADIRKKLFRYSPFCSPATIYRRDAALKAGSFDTYFASAGAEDYDFYFRIGRYGAFGNLPDVLVKLRTHPGSISQSRARRQERLTIEIRHKARTEYGYPMSGADRIYTFLQSISSFVIPPRAKFWMFNRLRSAR